MKSPASPSISCRNNPGATKDEASPLSAALAITLLFCAIAAADMTDEGYAAIMADGMNAAGRETQILKEEAEGIPEAA